MGIINNKSKIAIGIITFLGLVFLVRAYVIYSFYKNDELYGDGIPDTAKYDKEFLSTVMFSVLIMIVLSLISILIFKKKQR
ncbi:hypothetical protein [Chryseobacterium sp. JK1]|uniref:hypothetical protein n=1 Tax=Chryseobacterium sp. JK1 TaxID=874294 RepID=UPI003D68BBF6